MGEGEGEGLMLSVQVTITNYADRMDNYIIFGVFSLLGVGGVLLFLFVQPQERKVCVYLIHSCIHAFQPVLNHHEIIPV